MAAPTRWNKGTVLSSPMVGISLWNAGYSNAWEDYYFVKNLQGDVLKVYRESDHAEAASYSYDSWGNILASDAPLSFDGRTIKDLNPFRYRTYYYDNETWFYYLQSRYYDPAIGRFVNADVLVSTGQGVQGFNMFAYCGNNPVCRVDTNGTAWQYALAGGGLLATSFSSISTVIATGLSAITPVGWIVLGSVAVVSIVVILVEEPTTKTNPISERKNGPIGRRKNFNSKKKAREAAKRAGGGKEPIHHPRGCHENKRPHYHPNVKNGTRQTPNGVSYHDHYYYPG